MRIVKILIYKYFNMQSNPDSYFKTGQKNQYDFRMSVPFNYCNSRGNSRNVLLYTYFDPRSKTKGVF